MPELETSREQRGSDRKPAEVERGSLKQDMHNIQTDLIVPCTVQLTEQTPVVADHTVKKVSHGLPRWPNLRSERPWDTLRAAPHCQAPPHREECAEKHQQPGKAASPSPSAYLPSVLRSASISGAAPQHSENKRQQPPSSQVHQEGVSSRAGEALPALRRKPKAGRGGRIKEDDTNVLLHILQRRGCA